MSTWITADDYKVKITDNRLNMIIEADSALLDDAESTAIAIIKDALYPYYDIDTIFTTAGTLRPAQVVRWVVSMSLYFLYERIPDKLVPDRVVQNYQDTKETLFQISDGKHSINLPRAVDEEGETKSKFRWGGETKRLHS
jgi:hypothetical protein